MADASVAVPQAIPQTQDEPKFVPSTADLPPAMDDNAVRAIFAEAAAKGIDDLNATIQTQAPQGQPNPAPVQEPPIPKSIPAKFQKPDGTVDEEKLKTSSTRLDEALQEKQKTVDELLADYEAKQKELGNLGNKQGQIKKQLESLPPPETIAPAPQAVQPPDAVRAQLLQLAQTDPIAFAVEIARAVARKEAFDIAAPALEVTQNIAEQSRIAATRANIAALAEQDPRVLQGPLYEELKKELNNPNENYWSLKNPHKAAWNEVKDRLRLGEAPKAPVQPSNPGPILGRGSPATVQEYGHVQTPQTMYEQVTQVNPYSEEGKRIEQQLREASKAVWRA